MTRRFRVSLVLTAPILAFMVAGMIPALLERDAASGPELDRARPGDAGRAVGRLAVLRAWLGVGRQPQPEHVHAHRAGRRRRLRLQRRGDARCPDSFPTPSGWHGDVAVYFEAAAVIVVLVLLGQVLELRARSRTSGAIRQLLGLAPKTAASHRADGAEDDVPLEHVHVGDRLRVRPGERVPVDGDRGRRAEQPWTSRWSPASRFRLRRQRAAR